MESSARNKRKLSNITLIKEKTLFFSLQISMDILFIFIAEIWNFSLAMDITYFKNREWNVYRSATSKQAVIYVNLFRFLNRVIILLLLLTKGSFIVYLLTELRPNYWNYISNHFKHMMYDFTTIAAALSHVLWWFLWIKNYICFDFYFKQYK